MNSSISGFPEFLPNEQITFNKAVDEIKNIFELYGFVPMDTPAVERTSVLLAKGNDHEIYGIHRLADENIKNDLGLRFDLTVPLARYVSDYASSITFPYRRYHIAPVWRGERPQYGRYRQFYQCDIDIVGDGELSLEHDAEVLAIITQVLAGLNLPDFKTRVNNKKILTGFLKTIIEEKSILETTKLIDKVNKISIEEFEEGLEKLGFSKDYAAKIHSFIDLEKRGDNHEVLRLLKSYNFNPEYIEGVEELEYVLSLLKKLEVPQQYLKISTKISRGLEYYTGLIFETSFDNFGNLGSIAAGGRYDNLTEMISDKKFPGVGGTIGISRLIPTLIEKGVLEANKQTSADVLITVQNREYLGTYMKIATKFRDLGIKTETFLQDKNLNAQLKYAHRKNFKFVIIANEMELLEGTAIIRNLETRQQKLIRTEFIGKEILEIIK